MFLIHFHSACCPRAGAVQGVEEALGNTVTKCFLTGSKEPKKTV